MKSALSFIIPLLLIILISFFTFYPSFNLALFGDDWYALWNYLHYFGPNSSGHHLFSYLFDTYGPQDFSMGVLYNIFGLESQNYYIVSYFFRLLAAVSLWPAVYYLTKSKLAAFSASLFFSVTIIGLETTNWVFNMPSYLAIASFNIFLYFYIKSLEKGSRKLLIPAGIFFTLAHIFAPIRMTGLLLFTVIIELFWILLNGYKNIIKISALRLMFIFAIFILIGTTNKVPGTSSSVFTLASSILGNGFGTIQNLLSQGRSDFLFYPIMTIGRMVTFDTLTLTGLQIPSLKNFYLSSLPIFFGFVIIAILVLSNSIKSSRRFTLGFIIAALSWTIFSGFIFYINKLVISAQNAAFLLLGGYCLILGITLFIQIRKEKILAASLFISMSWTVLSFIFTWFRAPETLLSFDQRYLIPSAAGIAIFLGTAIGLGRTKKQKNILFALVSVFIILNIIATKAYLTNAILNSHGREATEKIWSQIPYIPNLGKTADPLIFYFYGDNPALIHHTLAFGFPYHMAILYSIYDTYNKMPVPMEEWKEVVSAAKDGKSLVSRQFPARPVPIENIYAFFLKPDNILLNITEEARSKLELELK